jgi:hypothetical protein
MAKDFFIPGLGMINDEGGKDFFIPGLGMFNGEIGGGGSVLVIYDIEMDMEIDSPTLIFHGATAGRSSMFLVF